MSLSTISKAQRRKDKQENIQFLKRSQSTGGDCPTNRQLYYKKNKQSTMLTVVYVFLDPQIPILQIKKMDLGQKT